MISPDVRAQMRRLVLVERMRIEAVARRFGVHHTTVRRAIADELAPPPERPSVLEPFKAYIVDRPPH